MIKINLAARKQVAGATSADADGGKGLKSSLSRFTVDFDKIKGLPIRKVAVSLVVAIGLTYLLNSYKEDELAKATETATKLVEQRTKLQAELSKTKGLDEEKKRLEADELLIKTKMDTIQSLITDRQTPPKVLLSLAQSIPKDVWLSEFRIAKSEVTLKGTSIGFNPISDFMKGLTENSYFSDVSLKSTQQAKDEAGIEVASFELNAKRREQK